MIPSISLSDGMSIPQLGLGVWQVPDDVAITVVADALAAGYRSVDTAAIYGNERGVGAGFARSGLGRDAVHLTTKVWNSDHGYDEALAAVRASLSRLAVEQLDLVLIHWPAPAQDRYVDTWQALLQARADGLARSVGVSNFQPAHLTRLADETGEMPPINQVELHPHFQQAGLRAFHREHGIVTEAWSPLGQGSVLGDPVIGEIASGHGVSPAQVILRWHLQLGNVVIPKSVQVERLRQNLDVFGFELSAEEFARIARLETGKRVGPDPDTFG
ncbi:MAG: aldo/keto reductase [Actinomycetota bacterium]